MTIPNHEIERVIREVIDRFLIPRHEELGMRASGDWIESLEAAARDNVGIIRGLDYTEFLVRGRRPGGFPPRAVIEKWIADKGIVPDDGISTSALAFLISRKIANEGTEYYKQGGTTLLEILEEPEVIEYIKKEIADILVLEVQTRFKRILQK